MKYEMTTAIFLSYIRTCKENTRA